MSRSGRTSHPVAGYLIPLCEEAVVVAGHQSGEMQIIQTAEDT